MSVMTAGGKSLRILLIEDSEEDAKLLTRELDRGGYAPVIERVETAAAFGAALDRGAWDVVLSDYSLPSFGALAALDIVHRAHREMPFLVVSGSIGEESAVQALKAGVGDIISKKNLGRLVPAIERELRDAQVRRERREALVALTQAVHVRDEFLSIASHELKTPLTSLQLQVQSLARALNGGGNGALLDKPRLSRMATMVNRQTERLTELINRMLDISRVTTGRLDLTHTEVDLVRLATDAVERLGESALDVGSKIELESSGAVVGVWDAERIDAVLSNLLLNAIKYGEGKPITIVVEDLGDDARVSVQDIGIGIAPEDQERIFGRFERAVSIRHYGGFGVGLWISRQIVEAHGGRIEVTSATGGGSIFAVILPKKQIPAESARGVAHGAPRADVPS